jgi:C_GCAxxG_C_C family probable redox protein
MSGATAAGEDAVREFQGGLYCAESVLLALARAQGIESEHLPAIATGFCSGLARTKGPCGAVMGAVMALGLAYGRDRGDQGVAQNYAAVQALLDRFAAEFGATACADLLGCDLGTAEGQETFKRDRLFERCFAYTRRAAELGAELAVAPPKKECGPKRCGCAPD